jgi:acetate kinase
MPGTDPVDFTPDEDDDAVIDVRLSRDDMLALANMSPEEMAEFFEERSGLVSLSEEAKQALRDNHASIVEGFKAAAADKMFRREQ